MVTWYEMLGVAEKSCLPLASFGSRKRYKSILSKSGLPRHRVVGDGTEDNGNPSGTLSLGHGGNGDSSGGGGSGVGGKGGQGGASGGSGDGGSDRRWSHVSGCNGSVRPEKNPKIVNPGEDSTGEVDQMNMDPESHDLHTTGYSADLAPQIIRGKSPTLYQAQFRSRAAHIPYQSTWDSVSMTRSNSSGDVQSMYTGHTITDVGGTSSSRNKGTGNITKSNSAPLVVRCGEITARLLSALIQEATVPQGFLATAMSSASNYAISVTNAANKDEVADSGTGNGEDNFGDGFQKDNANADGTVQISPAQRQQNNLLEIEERLKRELKTLGIIEANTGNNSNGSATKEEHADEICQELKKVQRLLQEQVIANKQRRAKYYPLVKEKMELQKQEQEERKRIFEAEEQANKQIKLLKRKKRTTTTQPIQQPSGKKARMSAKSISTSHTGSLDAGRDNSQFTDEFQDESLASARYDLQPNSYDQIDSVNLHQIRQNSTEKEINVGNSNDFQRRDMSMEDNGFAGVNENVGTNDNMSMTNMGNSMSGTDKQSQEMVDQYQNNMYQTNRVHSQHQPEDNYTSQVNQGTENLSPEQHRLAEDGLNYDGLDFSMGTGEFDPNYASSSNFDNSLNTNSTSTPMALSSSQPLHQSSGLGYQSPTSPISLSSLPLSNLPASPIGASGRQPDTWSQEPQ